MANIYELLEQINSAIYGEDVRESIHDAIAQCYEDATGNSNSLSALVNMLKGSASIIKGEKTVDSLVPPAGETLVHTDVPSSVGAFTNIDSIYLTPGIYLVIYAALNMTYNTSGDRQIIFRGDGSGDSPTVPRQFDNVVAVPDEVGEVSLKGAEIVYITEDDPYLIDTGEHAGSKLFKLYLTQDSGETLGFASNITALKLLNYDPNAEDTTLTDIVTTLSAEVAALSGAGLELDANDYLIVG